MNRLFLDTTVLIDLSKDSRDVVTSLKALVATGAVLGVSVVSVAEFFTAVPVPERRQWQKRIADFEYWDISREAALFAGVFRYDSARQGRALHIHDALMTATAVVTDATLVTSKIKDYPMPSLRLLRLGS